MSKLPAPATAKRLRNRYRLVVMNDDTYEEVATFKLTRLSVYIAMSTLFVLLTGLSIALVSFTSLKFLIPGYGTQGSLQALRQLKIKTDSLERTMVLKDAYLNGVQRVLRGDTAFLKRDTATLVVDPVAEEITD